MPYYDGRREADMSWVQVCGPQPLMRGCWVWVSHRLGRYYHTMSGVRGLEAGAGEVMV